MQEVEEMKLRKVFFNTIITFLYDNSPENMLQEEHYQNIAFELTDYLIEDYEDYCKAK